MEKNKSRERRQRRSTGHVDKVGVKKAGHTRLGVTINRSTTETSLKTKVCVCDCISVCCYYSSCLMLRKLADNEECEYACA